MNSFATCERPTKFATRVAIKERALFARGESQLESAVSVPISYYANVKPHQPQKLQSLKLTWSNFDAVGSPAVAKKNAQNYNAWFSSLLPEGTYLSELDALIEKARYICSLENDWDEMGSLGYKVETFDRACSFVYKSAISAAYGMIQRCPMPEILPGPNGSIDVHWKTKRFELLVNFPEDPGLPASFYGDNYGIVKIKGTIDSVNPSSELVNLLAKA